MSSCPENGCENPQWTGLFVLTYLEDIFTEMKKGMFRIMFTEEGSAALLLIWVLRWVGWGGGGGGIV